MSSNTPLESAIQTLSDRRPRPFSLPIPLAEGVVLNSHLIRDPDILTRVFGFWSFSSAPAHHVALARRIIPTIDLSSALVNRSLTQEELDFHIEDTSRNMAMSRSGPVWGVAMAIFYTLYWRRDHLVLNPFMPKTEGQGKPRPVLIWEAVRNIAMTEPVTFRQGLIALASRFSLAGIGGWIVTNSLAMSGSVAKMSTDARLAQYRHDLNQQERTSFNERRRAVVVARGRIGQQYGERAETSQASQDEPAWTETATPSAPETSTVPAQKEASFFDDDDASPISPEHQGDTGSAWDRIRSQAQPGSGTPRKAESGWSSPPEQNGSQASAWDRIRQQGAPEQNRSWQTEPAATGQSDIQQDRARAQAEFNKLLDAERSRGD